MSSDWTELILNMNTILAIYKHKLTASMLTINNYMY